MAALPFEELADATRFHVPGSGTEALILTACLLVGAFAGRRIDGWRLGALIALSQFSGFWFVGHIAIPLTEIGRAHV